MNDRQTHIASIQIPDITHIDHRVNLIYGQLQYSTDVTYLIEKFYTVLLFTPATVEQHRANFQQDKYMLDLFIHDELPNVPVLYVTFLRDLLDAIADKVDSIVTQAQTLKSILTGQPHISALQLEKHATGWYLVLY